MKFTTSKIFLDNSVFVEGYKGRHQEYVDYITGHSGLECCVNDVVCSEYWFHLFALTGNASPLALKERAALQSLIQKHRSRLLFFNDFTFLISQKNIVPFAFQIMEQYQLLPNDSLIAAACKILRIPFLASHDSELELACTGEGITLITTNNYRQLLPPLPKAN